jgi:hypothetical protein
MERKGAVGGPLDWCNPSDKSPPQQALIFQIFTQTNKTNKHLSRLLTENGMDVYRKAGIVEMIIYKRLSRFFLEAQVPAW